VTGSAAAAIPDTDKGMNLAFPASLQGSNMQAVIDACKSGRLKARPRPVIRSNGNSEAPARARREGIPAFHMSAAAHPDRAQLDQVI
jgi:phosphoribosylglycinamide formyltransferase-1